MRAVVKAYSLPPVLTCTFKVLTLVSLWRGLAKGKGA